MHFCMDEMMALIAAIPAIGFFFAWLRAKRHHEDAHLLCPYKPTKRGYEKLYTDAKEIEEDEESDGTASMTDQDLAKGFAEAVKKARTESLASGVPVVHVEGDNIIRLFPNGQKETLKKIK